MVGIIDYGMGNLLSVYHALEMVGSDVKICKNPKDLNDVDRIVLPGVGAFRDCMSNLKHKGFVEALHDAVLLREKPIFGICLGMQAMAARSFEGGEYQGLAWFDADVVRLQPKDISLKVPQVGWNEVTYKKDSPVFTGLPLAPDFYFVHSYFMKCKNEKDVEATCEYGDIITAAVRKDNIIASQFHPEKSQDYGLKLLANFLKWKP